MLQIVEQARELLSNHVRQFVFKHHDADVPRLVEPRSPLPGLSQMMLQAIGRVKKREVAAIVPAVAIAHAQVHIDAVFEVLEGQRAARLSDGEMSFLHRTAQMPRVVNPQHIEAVAPNLHHFVKPALGVFPYAVGSSVVSHSSALNCKSVGSSKARRK